MAEVKTGVFPVNELDIQIDKSSVTSRSKETSFVPVADLVTASIGVETGVETWNPFDQKGWQRALATAKALNISFSGKRNYGDEGNDYIASKWLKNGQECNSTLQIGFPDGSKVQIPCVIQVTSKGGDSTNVAPLEFTIMSDGKPTYTPAEGAQAQ